MSDTYGAMGRPLSVHRQEAQEVRDTPFGSVGVVHAGGQLKAWWVWKEQEDVDPEWKVNSHDDFLCVIRGALKLELRSLDDVVLAAGDTFVIPAGVAFRGYRWPRESEEPCVFVAVSPADQEAASETTSEAAG